MGRMGGFLTPVLLAFSVGLSLYQLRPELTVVPFLHDGVQHFLSLTEAIRQLKAGQDPTDTWVPGMVIGFPLFHYYQHLPYVLPAIFAYLAGDAVSTDILFRWITYLLISVFPLSIYWAMRRLGFERPASVGGALAAPLLSSNGLFGFDMGSYTWRGFGLYTQLWGMILLPPALACGYSALREGRGYFLAVLLLTATALSHLAFAYIAFISMALLAMVTAPRSQSGIQGTRLSTLLLVLGTALANVGIVCLALVLLLVFSVFTTPRAEIGIRCGRLLVVMIPLGMTTSYFLLPLVLDRAYVAHSVWDAQWKYDSFGAPKVLEMLGKGEVFDHGRASILTTLSGLGLLVSLWRWSEPRYRVPAIIALLWLVAWFGRPFWGGLLDYTPLSQDFYFHRLIAGVHLGGIFLIGIAVGAIVSLGHSQRLLGLLEARRAGSPQSNSEEWTPLSPTGGGMGALSTVVARAAMRGLPLIVVLAIALPLYRERDAYLKVNGGIVENNRVAFATEQRDLDRLLGQLGALPTGRVYAGLAGTWGAKYKVGEVPMYGLLTQRGFDMLSFLYHVWSLNGDTMTMIDDNDFVYYDLYNLRYIVAPETQAVPTFARLIGSHGRHRLYEVATSGYFDLVTAGPVYFGDRNNWWKAASYWQSTDEVGAKEHPIVSFEGAPSGVLEALSLTLLPRQIPAVSTRPEQPSRGRILAESVAPSRYETRVQVDQPSALMLKVSFHPNWHAYVDGAEVRTFQLMPSYVGVDMTPGTHQVRMEYRPQPLRTVLLFTGLLTFLLLAVAERRRDLVAGALHRLPLGAISARLPRLPTPAWSIRAPPRLVVTRTGPARTLQALWTLVRPHVIALGAVGFLTLLGGWPLLQGKLMSGHDYLEYLPRNVEFWRALTGGQIIPRWAPDLSAGYGEPFFNFNPPLIYYTTSLFRALGFTFITAENLACLALLAAAGVGMYLLANEFFGKRGGVVAASAYIFAPFLDSRLYVSHALADFSAFPFIPFAVWGLHRFAETGRYRFLVVGSLAVAVLTLASNPISLITLPFLALLVLLLAIQWRSVSVAIGGAACVGVGMALSAFFWMPALAEREFVHVHRLVETFLNYNNHFAYLQQLGWLSWGYGVSVPGLDDGMSFALGIVHVGAAIAAGLTLQRVWRRSTRVGLMVILALAMFVIAAFMSVGESKFLWERLPLLQYFEYPWRFHVLANVATAFLLALPFLFLRRRSALAANATMAALVGAVLLFNLGHARPEKLTDVREADFTAQIIAERYLTATTALEYEPIWVLERPGLTAPAPPPATIVAGQGLTYVQRRTPTELQLRSESLQQLRLRLNTFYFPGWTLYVDGNQRPVDRDPAYGVMETTLAPGLHNVRLAFEATPVRQWSERLSILALVLLAMGAASRRRWTWPVVRRPTHAHLDLRDLASYRLNLTTKRRLLPSQSQNRVVAPREPGSATWISSCAVHLPYVCVLILIVVLAGLPLFQLKLMTGWDSRGYVPVSRELYEGLLGGEVFPRWAPDLSYGYGLPALIFLPPLIHYLTVFFHATGFGFVAAENVACFALLLCSGLSMYLLAQEFFGPRGGTAAAVAYVLAPWLTSRLYVSHALRDFSAFAFLPLALWGLQRLLQGGGIGAVAVTAGSVAFLILGSAKLPLILLPTLILFAVFLWGGSTNARALLKGLTAVCAGLGLAGFFWVPAAIESPFIHLERLRNSFPYEQWFVPWTSLLYSPWISGPISAREGQQLSYGIGPIHLFMTCVALVVSLRVRNAARGARRAAQFFLWLVPLAAFLTTAASSELWAHFEVLQLLEPPRFLILVALGTAFICGVPFVAMRGRPRVANASLTVVVAALVFFESPHARPEGFLDVRDNDFSPNLIASNGWQPTAVNEIEPTWANLSPTASAQRRLQFVSGAGQVVEEYLAPSRQLFRLSVESDARVRANALYFPGWELRVDGQEKSIDIASPEGVMEFGLLPGLHNVELRFADTPVRLWAGRFSLLCLLLLVAALLGRLSKRSTPSGVSVVAPQP